MSLKKNQNNSKMTSLETNSVAEIYISTDVTMYKQNIFLVVVGERTVSWVFFSSTGF